MPAEGMTQQGSLVGGGLLHGAGAVPRPGTQPGEDWARLRRLQADVGCTASLGQVGTLAQAQSQPQPRAGREDHLTEWLRGSRLGLRGWYKPPFHQHSALQPR